MKNSRLEFDSEVVIVSCAGSARRSERRVASHTSEEQRRNAPARAAKNGILDFSASLKLNSVFNAMKDQIPTLLKNESSVIVNLASVLAQVRSTVSPVYTAAKHAATGWLQSPRAVGETARQLQSALGQDKLMRQYPPEFERVRLDELHR